MGKSNRKLYEILGITKDATTRDVIKAYRLAALKTHPDKIKALEEKSQKQAQDNFTQLQHAYEILKDEEKRKNYDLYGWEGEEDAAFVAAYLFYKDPIKKEDIDSFAKTYKNSKAEHEDLLDFYNKYDGDLTEILSFIPLSEPKDVSRFVKFFQDKIKNKTIVSTSKFTSSSRPNIMKAIEKKYSKLAKKEEEEAGSLEDLAAQILANRNKRAAAFSEMLDCMEAKYKTKKLSKK